MTSPAMTQAGVILGTAAYMSPEQARGRPVDKRADINGRAETNRAGVGGQTPIFHAVTQADDGGVPVTRLLVDRGADLTIRVTVLGHYERPGELIECTPLGYALGVCDRPRRSKVVACLRDRRAPEQERRRIAMRMSSRLTFAVMFAVVLAAVAACGQAPAPAAAPPVNPLHGAWSVVSQTPVGGDTIDPAQPGLWVFTERHYSSVYATGAEPRPMAATLFAPTAEEKVAQYDSIIVNSGTYEVNGSSITFRPMVARSPEFVGGQAVMDFRIDGDTLTLSTQTLTSADGTAAPGAAGSSMRLRRVE